VHETGDVLHEFGDVRGTLVAVHPDARDERLRKGLELLTVLHRHAEHFADHDQRQLLAEVRDQVGSRAFLNDLVGKLAGDRQCPRPQPFDPPRGERARDQLA
jgi:hypothetical protein